MTTVAIIIVNYNSAKDTDECLLTLTDIVHDHFSYQVFIVDNGSKQPYKLPKLFQEKSHFEVVRSEANLGFTGGNNLGIEYAIAQYQPDYVLLLNNDTTVHPHFLEELVAAAQNDVSVGLVGSKILFYPGREFHQHSYRRSQRGQVLWFAGASWDWQHLVGFHRGVDELDRGQFDQTHETEFITGCSMLIPRSVIDRVGLLDENYFVYLEDVDYSQRVKLAGFSLQFCPSSIVWHKNAGSSGGSGSQLHAYYQSRNRLWFSWKYGDRWAKLKAVRLALRLLSGSASERKAVIDVISGRMGKQSLL